MLKAKIEKRASGLLFYGITPPKINTDPEKIGQIAERQIRRLHDSGIDGLILYDIQDESSRNAAPRPFPFLETLDPHFYSSEYLKALPVPKIVYNSIGKYTEESFEAWVEESKNKVEFSVFVGSPSKYADAGITLEDAYRIRNRLNGTMMLGGVTIPERHIKKGNEHLRVFEKIGLGCRFFISQCVYNVNNSKSFLSDYYYCSRETGQEMVPVVFTITPCGSVKTLQFMEWLGIEIPRWLQNELFHSHDILSQSLEICKRIAEELLEFAYVKGIPVGFNIESVAIRKEEIEASVALLHYVGNLMKK